MCHFYPCRVRRGRPTVDQVAEPITLTDELDSLTEFWSQRVVAEANGNMFKVAKGVGSTNWHSHDDQDEVFLLIEGDLTVQLGDRDVVLRPGDLFVVPRGVEHRPVADGEARFMIIGPSVTSNAAGGKPAWSASAGLPRA
jgi:quercetin dioxygenase-like cupin family protein